MERIAIPVLVFRCQKCREEFAGYDLISECPLCKGNLSLVEKRLEMKEVVFVHCPKCKRIFPPKEEIICPICGSETRKVIN